MKILRSTNGLIIAALTLIGLTFLFSMLFTSNDSASPSQMMKGQFCHWQQGIESNTISNHYIDNKTGITLTLYSFDNERSNLSNFAPNFRGVPVNELPFSSKQFKEWKIEYFCEPDWVISYYTESFSDIFYINSLKWEKSFTIDQDDKIILRFHHHPSYGLINKQRSNLPLEIEVKFTWVHGNQWVDVEVTINTLQEGTCNLCFIAQDAAFMWFPYANQSDVQGLSIDGNSTIVGDFIKTEKGLNHVIAGTQSVTHGIFAGFQILECDYPDGASLRTSSGVIDRYLLVPKNIPVGYQHVPEDQKQLDQ